MPDSSTKVLLNNTICSGLSGEKVRQFERVEARHLNQPEQYRAEFFETLPTMWATAYVFQRAVEGKDQKTLGEWVALLQLFSYRVFHLEKFEQAKLQNEFDPDLWPAISGTYPSRTLDHIQLLRTERGTVIGGYYPGTVFFPSRGRNEWESDENLQPYLDNSGTRLSWERCCELLLPDHNERKRSLNRLLSIAQLPELNDQVRGALLGFIKGAAVFRNVESTDPLEQLESDPRRWPPLGSDTQPDLLQCYPFKKPRNGGLTYYLLTGLPVSADWMKKQISPGLPAPNQYERHSRSQIRVRFDGDRILQLGPNDEIVLLNDLFLDREPYYCAMDKTQADENTSLIRRLHKREITNNTGPFSAVKATDEVICFAPVKSAFLKHFPEVLARPEGYLAVRGRSADGGLVWDLDFFGHSLIWPTVPSGKPLQDLSLSIWPPLTHDQWRVYLAHGTGAKREKCGRLRLIGEQGQVNNSDLELADDEYINILKPDEDRPDQPCRPRALTIVDFSNAERGVLFFAEAREPANIGLPAHLAVDFGTSNTSMAYKFDDKPEPLFFQLSPTKLWGAKPKIIPGVKSIENPGFVPFHWGGSKGYFPTILLKRKNANLEGVTADQLQIEHLFMVDIPGLHKDMEFSVFDGSLQANWPELHKDMKWHSDPKQPWRRPAFLGLALLYAHAEMFFRFGAMIEHYVFTFPLAFTTNQELGFREETRQVVSRIREFCFGTGGGKLDYVNESAAIATSVKSRPDPATLEVFVDIGGGTTDIAIRYNGNFVVLDSIKVAGKSFFAFTRQNFAPELDVAEHKTFKQHLGRLLMDRESEQQVEETVRAARDRGLDLGNLYSLVINRLDDRGFRDKESLILQKRTGWGSYQVYRSELFFRHILTYALLQASAVAVDRQLLPDTLSNGIKLILSGNGWGLLLFGEFQRSKEKLLVECNHILELLKSRLLRNYDADPLPGDLARECNALGGLKIADIDLLNERSLSKAKTDVTVGALNMRSYPAADDGRVAPPYSGITLRQVKLNVGNETTVRWCDRWDFEAIKRKARQPVRSLESFMVGAPANYMEPLDHPLVVFTILGGNGDHDPMPGAEWHKINSALTSSDIYVTGKNLTDRSPINQFISDLLYPEDADHTHLDVLATVNKTLK